MSCCPGRASMLFLSLFGAVVAVGGCDGGEAREPTLSAIRRDIFEPRCNFGACHGGGSPVRGLGLGEGAFAALVDVASAEDPNVKRVVPGDPDASLLYRVLQGPVGGTRQMPVGSAVDAADLEQVRAWIESGAEDN
jgi:hypothetical protein